MTARSNSRFIGATAIAGGATALVGNLLAPRFNGEDVNIYMHVAHSNRFTAANVIILIAFVLVITAFVGLTDSANGEAAPPTRLVRSLIAAGGAVALTETALQIYAYKQQARAFVSVPPNDRVSAFWATNAVDHISAAMFALWTLVLLGLVPVALGIWQLRGAVPGGRIGGIGAVGGLVCAVVGFASLLKDDQSTFNVPFLIGSLLVTAWLITSGAMLTRSSTGASQPRSARTLTGQLR